MTRAQRQLKYELTHKQEGWPRRHEFRSMGREHLGLLGQGSPRFESKFTVYKNIHDEYGVDYTAFFATPSILEQSTLIADRLKTEEANVLFTSFGDGSPVSAPASWWAKHYGDNHYSRRPA